MSMADTKQVVFLFIFLFDHDVLPVGFGSLTRFQTWALSESVES